MAANELIIKIGASSKGLQDELDKVKSEVKDLESQLAGIAKISGVAFVGLTAAIGVTVGEFYEAEQAANALTASLKNQGINSQELADDYDEQASALQDLAGFSDDAAKKGIALLQNQVGQIKITKELSTAVANLAAGTGMDLEQAFALVGKTIGTSTNALARQGIEIDATASKQEKIAAIIEQTTNKFNGQAAAMGEGLGKIKVLQGAISDLSEEFGKQFAPTITKVTEKLIVFVKAVKDNQSLIKFAAALAGVVTVISGAVAAFSTIGVAITAMTPLVVALGAAFGPVLIVVGAVSVAVGLLAASLVGAKDKIDLKNKSSKELSATLQDLQEQERRLEQAQKNTYNLSAASKQRAVLEDIRKEIALLIPEINKRAEQEKKAGGAAVDRNNEELFLINSLKSAKKAESEAILLDAQGASKELIDLKKKEAAILKEIGNKENKDRINELERSLDETIRLYEKTSDREIEINELLNEEILSDNKKFLKMDQSQRDEFLNERGAELRKALKSDEEISADRADDSIKKQIAFANRLKNIHQDIDDTLSGRLFQQPQIKQTVDVIVDFVAKNIEVFNVAGQAISGMFNLGLDILQKLVKPTEIAKSNTEAAVQNEKSRLEYDILQLERKRETGELDEAHFQDAMKRRTEEAQANIDRINGEAEAKDKASQEAIDKNQVAVSAISQVVGNVANVLLPGIGGFVTSTLELAAMGPDKIKKAIEEFGPLLKNALKSIIDGLPELLKGIMKIATDLVLYLAQNVDVLVQSLFDGLLGAVEVLIAKAPEIISTLVAKAPELIFKLVATLVDHADEIAIALIKGLVNGLIAYFETQINAIIDFVGMFIPGEEDHVKLKRLESGGMVGTKGVDSVPAMLAPGEMVVPFERVPQVVRQMQGGSMSGIEISFKGREASQMLTARMIEDRALGVSQEVA